MKKNKKKGVKISLGTKFSFIVGLLLTAIMISITVFIYNHEKEVLGNEVKQRGLAIAMNVANNASEALLNSDILTLSILANEVLQSPMKEKTDAPLLQQVIMSLKDEFIGRKEKEIIKNEGIVGAVIVDANGLMMDPKKAEQKYYPPSGVKPLELGQDYLIQEYQFNGKSYYDIAVPSIEKITEKKVGEVHLTVSQDVVSKTVLTAAVKVLVIMSVALIAGIIITIVLVAFMVKPVQELVKGVNAIGQGNYDVQIKIKSRDELGELTEAFNATAKSLKEKELLKGAFSTYVSGSIMEQILKDPGKLSLHGTKVKATMLFTDIRGFTSMSETMEPEQVVSIINEYLTLQTDKVFKWNGLLDKFVGDCVMAVYGVPFAKPDDSYRAVRTAMDIREGVEKMNSIRKKKNLHTVGIGIGINTGLVVSGNMGSPQKMDYTVIGDNVNLAARLEANAPAGQIWCSESTYLETRDKIEYEELPPIMVKGKKDPVKVYLPVKLKEGVM